MANYTPNFNLYRPNIADTTIDVAPPLDTNFTTIDTEIQNRKDEIDNHKSSAAAHDSMNITHGDSNVKDAIFDLNGQITTLGGRADGVDGQITALDGRITGAESRVTDIDGRIDNIVRSDGTSDTEIVDARGPFSVLRDRLDGVDSSLAEKAKQSDLNNLAYSLDSLGGKSYDIDPNFDNTPILQNAVDTLPLGSTILLSKSYRINTGIVITRRVNIAGTGLDSWLKFFGSGNAITLGKSDFSGTIESVRLENFSLDGGTSPAGVENNGIVIYRGLYNQIDMRLSWFNKTPSSCGIKILGGYSVNVDYFSATNTIHPRIGQCSTGIFMDDCVQNTIIMGGVVDGNPNDRNSFPYGININDVHSAGNLIIGTDVEDCVVGVRVNGVQNQLIRPRIENCNTKFIQDTNGGQTHIVGSWGLDDASTVVNNGGQLKMDVAGYDLLSQLVKVVAPNANTAALLQILGGSSSNSILQLLKGTTPVFEVSNIPGGNDVRMFALQADNTMHEMMGFRTNGYIAKAYLKGALTFDNALNSGDVPNNSLFRHDATGKLSFKDNSGVVNALY